MAPKPKRQNPQHQPLTVALKKVCRDYPAGSGVFRELLQNSDDAGASSVRFCLDTSTHPSDPVLLDGLQEYQGPALLAYNDATFSKEDFDSVTSLGNSRKLMDKEAVGKFGLGFSSVYNWTDCPSIVSGQTLLLLDPHHSWSKEQIPPGGPEYCFTEHAADSAIINHLNAFKAADSSLRSDRAFNGTIIRLSLRTRAQADRSEISKKETTTEEIKASLETFVQEIGIQGLLFLKSVRRIAIIVDGRQLHEVEVQSNAHNHGILKDLQSQRTALITGSSHENVDFYLESKITHRTLQKEITETYGILHILYGSQSSHDTVVWAAAEKMYPWVAVAKLLERLSRPLSTDPSSAKGLVADHDTNASRLFTVLPLPITTDFPLHVHSLFSISGDRSDLIKPGNGASNPHPGLWNTFLYQNVIPHAWARLIHIVYNTHAEMLQLFLPSTNADSHSLEHNMVDNVISTGRRDGLAIWPTRVGPKRFQDALFTADKITKIDQSAFNEAQIPLAHIPSDVLAVMQNLGGCQVLSPSTILQFLKKTPLSQDLSGGARHTLLAYLLQQVAFATAGQLPLIPFKDGISRSLQPSQTAYIHRDSLENDLFSHEAHNTVDLTDFSEPMIVKARVAAADKGNIVKYRTVEDLALFLRSQFQPFAKDVQPSAWTSVSLASVWKWILKNVSATSAATALAMAPLLPLTDGRFRRLVPQNKSSKSGLYYMKSESTHTLATQLLESGAGEGPFVIAHDRLPNVALDWLLRAPSSETGFGLINGDALEGFIDFSGASCIGLNLSDHMKRSIKDKVQSLHWISGGRSLKHKVKILMSLPIFEAVNWTAAAATPVTRLLTDMNASNENFALTMLTPIPPQNGKTYFDATNPSDRSFFAALSTVPILDHLQTVERLVLPALRNHLYGPSQDRLRRAATEAVFDAFTKLSKTSRSCLHELPVIPLQQTGSQSVSFLRPSEFVDPSRADMLQLYLPHEIKHADKDFYDRYKGLISDCGTIQQLSWPLVESRVKALATHAYSEPDIEACVRRLLTNELHGLKDAPAPLQVALRTTEWLPAVGADGAVQSAVASTCGDRVDAKLVCYVWKRVNFVVSPAWRRVLGWTDTISLPTLESQVKAAITHEDHEVISNVLDYLGRHFETEEYAPWLSRLAFIQVHDGTLASAGTVCFGAASELSPYLHNVDVTFAKNHKDLLKYVQIPSSPTLDQLRHMQMVLTKTAELDESAIRITIAVARIWLAQYPEVASEIKLPNAECQLLPLDRVVYNDMHPTSLAGDVENLHRDVSRKLAEDLRIPTLSDFRRSKDLGLADEDDEYDQHEDQATGIRNTLERYDINATFNEYIANSDDTGDAKNVTFVVDEQTYPSNFLITPELARMQGPSLLVYNNSVFTERDFDGFKRVGKGSKRNDPNTVGQYGRGSQTMYHWTDTPMLLSGRYILLLDPLRQLLPFNPRTQKRKPGIKIKWSDLKKTCPDHLTPFERHFGFDSSKPTFQGTIFRFPLRRAGETTELLETKTAPTMQDAIAIFLRLESEALVSLLFLRNITSIGFRLQSEESHRWMVQRGNAWPPRDTFSGFADIEVLTRTVAKQENLKPLQVSETASKKGLSTVYRWYLAGLDIADPLSDVCGSLKRRQKYDDCGVAGLVQVRQGTQDQKKPVIESRFFNVMPLKFKTTLPVNVQATFSLSGDRQSISTEETARSAGSDHNNKLLKNNIPLLYLEFLGSLAREIGNAVFEFFPLKSSKPCETVNLSNAILEGFWQRVYESDCRIFPIYEDLMMNTESPDGRPGRLRNRRPPATTDCRSAVFALDAGLTPLRSILAACFKHLVCPTYDVRLQIRSLKSCAECKTVTRSSLRSSLTSSSVKEYLAQQYRKSAGRETLKHLIDYVMPLTMSDEDMLELSQCMLVPLCDGQLGVLSSMNSEDNNILFVPTNHEGTDPREIFAFAKARFLDEKVLGPSFALFTKLHLLNVKPFDLSHVATLLKMKNDWDKGSLIDSGWLYKFWRFVHLRTAIETRQTAGEGFDINSLNGFRLLHLVSQRGASLITSITDLDSLPAMYPCKDQSERDLLRGLPGLFLVHEETAPQKYAAEERSLSCPKAMARLLKCVKLIAEQSGLQAKLQQYLRQHENRKVLEKAARTVALTMKTSDLGLDALQDLPIWSNFSGKVIAARGALCAASTQLVVPWTQHHDRFARDCPLLRDAALDDRTMIVQHILPYLPATLSKDAREAYIQMLSAIWDSSNLWDIPKGQSRRSNVGLSAKPIALTKAGTLSLTSALYDHADEVFIAAFRGDDTKFLAIDVQYLKYLWSAIGLRQRSSGQFSGQHYLECLQAIALRHQRKYIQDANLPIDTATVLRPLCVHQGNLSAIGTDLWRQIAATALFPVYANVSAELLYRQDIMRFVAASRFRGRIHIRHCYVCGNTACSVFLNAYEFCCSTADRQDGA